MKPFDPSKYSTPASTNLKKTKIVSAAIHLARVSDARYYTSKSGNPTVEVTFEVIGPNDPDKGQPIPRQHYSFSEAGAWKPAQLTRALNGGLDVIFSPDDPEDLRSAWQGKAVAIRVRHEREVYEGRPVTREKVDLARAVNAREAAALALAYGPSLVPSDGELDEDAIGVGDAVGVEADDGFDAGDAGDAGDFSEDEIPF